MIENKQVLIDKMIESVNKLNLYKDKYISTQNENYLVLISSISFQIYDIADNIERINKAS